MHCVLAWSLKLLSKHWEHISVLFSVQCGCCMAIKWPKSWGPGHFWTNRSQMKNSTSTRRKEYPFIWRPRYFLCNMRPTLGRNPPTMIVYGQVLNFDYMNVCSPSRYFHCQLTRMGWCQGEGAWLLHLRHVWRMSTGAKCWTPPYSCGFFKSLKSLEVQTCTSCHSIYKDQHIHWGLSDFG